MFGFKSKRDERVSSLKSSLKRAVSRTSDNLNLQYGRFIMEEDIEKLRRKNFAHDFVTGKEIKENKKCRGLFGCLFRR